MSCNIADARYGTVNRVLASVESDVASVGSGETLVSEPGLQLAELAPGTSSNSFLLQTCLIVQSAVSVTSHSMRVYSVHRQHEQFIN